VQDGYKIYGQEQVIRNDSDYGDYFIDEHKYEELASCAVKPFDVLISLVGTIGKVLVLPKTARPGIINPRLVKISLNLNCYRANFFKAYFESGFLRSLYANESQGTTMDILNLGMIQRLPYPLCSVAEQDKILEVIEARLSEADQLDQTITTALQQAEALRQSILKKAFSPTNWCRKIQTTNLPRNCWRVFGRSGWPLRAIWLSAAREGEVSGDLLSYHVIPAKAGIYITLKIWIPAFAGMTDVMRGDGCDEE